MKLIRNFDDSRPTKTWQTPLSNYACAIRPIAAVMVTKIHGFRELCDNDQEAGLLLLSKSYKLQEYYFEQYECTRVVKMGDTVLASFHNVDKAVKCAFKIQRSAHKMFNHKLRIGLHMGEVRYVENDLFGSPVNIALDIQTLATPGQILASESIVRCLDHQKFAISLRKGDNTCSMQVFELNSIREQNHGLLRLPNDQETFGYSLTLDFEPKMVSGA